MYVLIENLKECFCCLSHNQSVRKVQTLMEDREISGDDASSDRHSSPITNENLKKKRLRLIIEQAHWEEFAEKTMQTGHSEYSFQ